MAADYRPLNERNVSRRSLENRHVLVSVRQNFSDTFITSRFNFTERSAVPPPAYRCEKKAPLK